MPSTLLWRGLWSSGALRLYQELRLRRVLTVVAFHRVLPAEDARWTAADPAWTLGAGLFRECLHHFRRHYAPVGLERVIGARERGEELPPRPLLVTFDDGWADTAEVALPLLAELGVPAVVFVSSGLVGGEPPWEDRVFAAWSEGRLGPEEADRLWSEAGRGAGEPAPYWGRMDALRRLVARLDALPEEERQGLLAERAVRLAWDGPPAMLSPAGLDRLRAAGLQIGSHGQSHRALTRVSQPEEELRASRRELSASTASHAFGGPVALSFPHGQSTPELEELALRSGYRLLFTSREQLNRVGAKGSPAVLGRIPIDGRQIVDRRGRFRPELLARWLLARPVAGEGSESPRGLRSGAGVES